MILSIYILIFLLTLLTKDQSYMWRGLQRLQGLLTAANTANKNFLCMDRPFGCIFGLSSPLTQQQEIHMGGTSQKDREEQQEEPTKEQPAQ